MLINILKYDNEKPIYIQIRDNIITKIVTGDYKKGAKLKGVRELAKEYKVNPNTIQKVLIDLNERKIIYSKKGVGNFITDNEQVLFQTNDRLIEKEIRNFIKRCYELNISKEEVIKKISNYKDDVDA